MKPSRPLALAEGLLANAIWASTFVFVKLALEEAGPLTVAGLRYFGGFLVLLPVLVRRGNFGRPQEGRPREAGRPRGSPLRSPRIWLRMLLIGLTAYTLGNGALYWGLQYMSATTASLLISLTPLPVLLIAIFWLREPVAPAQLAGLIVCLAGSIIFLSPGSLAGRPLGLALGVLALFSFATFGALGRDVARDRKVDTLSLTALPLGLGGGLLLLLALPLEGLPAFSAGGWVIVVWLAVVNTVFAYLIYNHALQTLTALEMNVMFNLGPIGTALIAWPLLGEALTPTQLAGMAMVVVGVIAVQRRGESVEPEPVVHRISIEEAEET
jgi:drug/metabolite transporter (DMT)-like permease